MSGHLRPLFLLPLAALALSLVAAAPAASPTGTDPCAAPLAEDEIGILPWHDLCALDVTASAAEDEPTTLEVRLRVVDTERLTPSLFSVRIDIGECVARLVFADPDTEPEGVSHLTAECEDAELSYDDCVVEVGTASVCRPSRPAVDVAPPTVDGDTYVWSITIDEELAQLVGALPPGTELDVRSVAAGSRVDSRSSTGTYFVSVEDGNGFERRFGAGGDALYANTTVVVTGTD